MAFVMIEKPNDYSALIPKCYLKFPGNNSYFLWNTMRKDWNSTISEEFKDSKGKKVDINMEDIYEAHYLNSKQEIALMTSVELTQNRRFKEYYLARFQRSIDHHKNDHGENISLEVFKIEGIDFYGTTSADLNSYTLGDYCFFPTDKMVICFRFLNVKDDKIKSIEDFISERDSLLKSYLIHISKCSTK